MMNVWMFDARPGERFERSAGHNRGVVVLDATAVSDPQAPLACAVSGATVIRRPRAGERAPGAVILLARRGPAGSWHGAGRAAGDSPVASGLDEGEQIARAVSSSNGGEHVVAVFRLGPGAEPVNILTSGYQGRRGWTVTTVHSDGRVDERPLDAWRAERQSRVVAL